MSQEFGPEEIEGLLFELDQRLRDRGIAASIYLVGGAAIALRHLAERRTADVDALIAPESEVLEVAREIAAERHIRPTWLNTAARPWVPPRPAEALAARSEPGLDQHIAPTEHLLAMKLVASR